MHPIHTANTPRIKFVDGYQQGDSVWFRRRSEPPIALRELLLHHLDGLLAPNKKERERLPPLKHH